MLKPFRSSRRPLRLGVGLGLALLLGSTAEAAAAAAGAGAALVGGVTASLGVLATLWALLGVGASAGSLETAGAAGLAGVMLVSGVWGWRHQRHRVQPWRRRGAVSAGGAYGGAPLPAAPQAVAPAVSASWPAALERSAVLDAARTRFLRLQAAWDAGDVHGLGQLTTPEMLEQLLPVLGLRGDGPNRTDVITLHVDLLGIEEIDAAYLASVEFSGLIRESAEQGAVPFRELWMLACSKDGASSWRLARQQALF